MGDIIKNIKEFIWDIVGYLIPGLTLLVILNLILDPSVKIKNEFLIDWAKFEDFLLVLVGYILGYVVYSITIFKIKRQDFLFLKLSQKWNIFYKYLSYGWENSFQQSATFTEAKSFLKTNGFNGVQVDNMKINEIRNILMSRDPRMDQKVYTFMFRSSLFDHLSTILILVVLLVIIQFGFSFAGIYFLKISIQFKVLYLLFLMLIPLLGNCKRIFFPIAKRIPFSNLKQ
jgi:hypothetical protein